MAAALPVVFVVAQSEAAFLLYAEHVGELEEMAVCLVGGGFADSDNTAAVVDKLLDRGGYVRVAPPFPAGMGRVGIPHVDERVDTFQDIRILLDVVKADETHVKRSSGEGLNDSRIGIILFEIQGMVYHVASPGTHFSPAVQDGDTLDAVGHAAFYVVIELAEFIADGLHIVYKFREIQRQLQVSAVPDPVYGLSQDGAAGSHPVDLGLLHGISAFVEGIREEIGQQAGLRIGNAFDVADQPQGGAISYASHNRVQPQLFKSLQERFGADPMVP